MFFSAIGSLVILWAAVQMMRLRSYGLAIAGSVLVLLSGIGTVLGVAIGVWSLVTLSRPDVRAAFTRRKNRRFGEATAGISSPSMPQGASPSAPRISAKGVVALVWAFFFLLCVAGFSFLRSPGMMGLPFRPDFVGPEVFTPSILMRLLKVGLMALVPVAVTAPFGTTILGLLALHDVRHSQGRIRGLGLALIGALFFPLLFLDALLVIGSSRIARAWYGVTPETFHIVPAFEMGGLLISLVLDALLFYWAWRAAKAPVS
jgi:hypothetical protein